MTNKELFQSTLTSKLHELFATPKYMMVARSHTPSSLAEKIVAAFERGAGDKDGDAVKATCKELAIPLTYKAIEAFLNESAK